MKFAAFCSVVFLAACVATPPAAIPVQPPARRSVRADVVGWHLAFKIGPTWRQEKPDTNDQMVVLDSLESPQTAIGLLFKEAWPGEKAAEITLGWEQDMLIAFGMLFEVQEFDTPSAGAEEDAVFLVKGIKNGRPMRAKGRVHLIVSHERGGWLMTFASGEASFAKQADEEVENIITSLSFTPAK